MKLTGQNNSHIIRLYIKHIQSIGTIPSSTLLTAQQTLTTESKITPLLVVCDKKSFCKTPLAERIWKCWRIIPMILSTYILTLANFHVASTSAGSNCSQQMLGYQEWLLALPQSRQHQNLGLQGQHHLGGDSLGIQSRVFNNIRPVRRILKRGVTREHTKNHTHF